MSYVGIIMKKLTMSKLRNIFNGKIRVSEDCINVLNSLPEKDRNRVIDFVQSNIEEINKFDCGMVYSICEKLGIEVR